MLKLFLILTVASQSCSKNKEDYAKKETPKSKSVNFTISVFKKFNNCKQKDRTVK